MAITHFLLHSNFISTPQTFHSRPLCSFPTKWSSCAPLKTNYSSCCFKTYHKSNTKCCFIMDHKRQCETGFAQNREGNITIKKTSATETGINEVIWRSMENVIKALSMTWVLLGFLFLYDHHLALAASGGRMGGRSFSSRSSSGSSSRSCSGSSSSSSGSRSYSSRTSRPSYSSSTSYSSSAAPVKAVEPNENDLYVAMAFFVPLVIIICFALKWAHDDIYAVKTSVLKLQVGSLGTGRSLQRELNRIAESADTSTPKGINYVLQEAILALLRHSDYCISGYSSVDVKKSVEACEKRFDQLSIEERGKFDEETLVNVNNIRKKSATSHSSNGLGNEYIVVTIIVAALGVPELPPIKNSAQLKKALQKLASIPSKDVMGAEVLWTPQKEDDSLTEQEMLKDYPLLHPL